MKSLLPWKPTACVASIMLVAAGVALSATPSAAQSAPPSTTRNGATVDRATADPVAAPTTDRIIVVWKQGSSSQARVSARGKSETFGVRRLGHPRFQLVRPSAGQSAADALAVLKANPHVESAERDGHYQPLAVPNDPQLNQLWGIRNTGQNVSDVTGAVPGADANVVPAWDRTVGTPSTIVADIDAGYDFLSPELSSVAWQNNDPPGGGDNDLNGYVDDYRGWDFIGHNADSPLPDNNPTDDNTFFNAGHGIHTAGTIGAKGNNGVGITGVAQNVRIMPLRVCSYAPSLDDVTCLFSSIIDAVNYAGANGARVANMSLGGNNGSAGLLAALAANPQTLYVAAAGNANQNGEVTPSFPCAYNPDVDTAVPTAIDNVICVAASDQKDLRAGFSNYGSTRVDLAAPGTETLSTYIGYYLDIDDDFSVNNFATNWDVNSGTFGRGSSGDGPLTSFGMTDSPGSAPVASSVNQVTWDVPTPVPPGYGPCYLQGSRHIDANIGLAGGGTFGYQILHNGVVVGNFAIATDTVGGMVSFFSADVVLPPSAGDVAIRFNYSAGTAPGTGVFLDDLELVCIGEASLAFLQGTSMAAPHVTGAAALMFSLKPAATVSQVRSAILSSVDVLPAWSGVVATGGRLDTAAALGKLVPPSTVIKRKPGKTAPNRVAFAFGRESAAAATYRCKLDKAAFVACSSPKTYKKLKLGKHTFRVYAVDSYGNADASPATATFKVVPCKVPNVRGKSLTKATTLLNKAGCLVGKVVKPGGVPLSKLVVKSTTPAAGAKKPSGYKVKVVLKKK